MLLSNNAFQSYHQAMQVVNQGKVARANDRIIRGDTLNANPQPIAPGTSDLVALNHKLVLEIRTDGDSLDIGEIAILQAIASQCEMLGGRAVSIARSLLAEEGEIIWEDPACNGFAKTELPLVGLHLPTTARCWPNPANDRLFFDFQPAGATGRIEVRDSRGIIVAEQSIDHSEGVRELSLKHLSQGMYLARAQLIDGATFSWKIVIQR
ncbi:MAG: T9SS type A sorting domain-containing protein [Bacteroidia bacterium]